MKEINKIKIRIIILFAIYVIVILLIILMIFIPSLKEIQQMSKNIKEQKEYLTNQYNVDKNLRSTSENLKIVKYNIQNLNDIFIYKDKEVEFITTLENIASKENIEQNIKITPPKDDKNNNYKKTQIQLTTSGNFENILNYLTELEKLKYYINIYSIDINKNQSNKIKGLEDIENVSTNVVCIINAYTYWK
ncbi:MAG: type 4a pilus biogenesis protein PilO [Patescibacteria group bacterium]|nr:type 4a pilus biogenesis protein PilO [Patescibacteria group bacterium]MDD4304809.1 type 4a pilus biogenesis protein PilO [Patescibacteria group bacterium]MDD4695861.1 type 4a pilus biogenesis protein PilO [Patescibacteria group bacterium]